VHLRGSVPPADERGRTVSCSREATATRRCAGQTRSRGRAGRAGLSPAWPQAHPPGRVGHGRARFATSIMLKVTRAMSAVTCLAAVVVRRDDVCFGSGWISRACGFSPTTTTRWTPWCSMWRRLGSETARSRVTAYPDKLHLNHPIAGGSKGSTAAGQPLSAELRQADPKRPSWLDEPAYNYRPSPDVTGAVCKRRRSSSSRHDAATLTQYSAQV